MAPPMFRWKWVYQMDFPEHQRDSLQNLAVQRLRVIEVHVLTFQRFPLALATLDCDCCCAESSKNKASVLLTRSECVSLYEFCSGARGVSQPPSRDTLGHKRVVQLNQKSVLVLILSQWG